jgi:DNA-binding transcriptional ArsR family regulator
MATALAEEDALWAAVADPTRRRVLDALLERGEASTTMLAEDLPVTRQAVAKHLVVLNRVGLVEGRRRGREVRYAVHPERLDAASEAMARVAAQWDRRLARIKRLAESIQAETQPDSSSEPESDLQRPRRRER